MDKIGLKGSIKVAILIKSMGMAASKDILNYFTDAEKSTIIKLASELGDVAPGVVNNIASEFMGLLGARAGDGLMLPATGGTQPGQAVVPAQPGQVIQAGVTTVQPGQVVQSGVAVQPGQVVQSGGTTVMQQGLAPQPAPGGQPGMIFPADQGAQQSQEAQRDSLDGKEEEKKQTAAVLTALAAMSSEQVLQLIIDEHPQTIALILVNLEKKMGSEVLGGLPEEKMIDVSYRIAKLDKILPGMITEINQVFADLLGNRDPSAVQKTDGVDSLADILNTMDGVAGNMILEEMEELDPEIVELIRQKMFVFDDLVLVDDRGMQNVLRSVETKTLALALKASADDVKDKIFSNISERAALILKEEIDSLGAVKMKDVSEAQLIITRIIQEKESKGEVVISGRGGEEFIG